MSDVAIKVENLSKLYRMGARQNGNKGGCVFSALFCPNSWQLPAGPDSHADLCRYGETSNQSIKISLKDGLYDAHAIGWTFVVKSKQQDTMVRLAASKDEFPEILIVGNDNAPFSHSAGQNIRVVSLRHGLGDGEHVVAGTAQVFGYCRAGRFINEELHADGQLCGKGKRKNFFVSQNLGRIGKSCADVIGLQTRVFPQNITLRDALGHHAHDEFHWDPSSPNDWLASHNPGVYGDTLRNLFVHLCAPSRVQDFQLVTV
jgi:hypothetical protein